MFQLDILYEDDHLAAVHKPTGMVVNRSDNAPHDTVQDWVESRWPQLFKQSSRAEETTSEQQEQQQVFLQRSGIAHRLDKDTSGILLIAKDVETLFSLFEQFQQRQVKKKYLALVHGKVSPKTNVIDAPIRRHPLKRTQYTVGEGGRPSQTEYQVLQHFSALDVEKVMNEPLFQRRHPRKLIGIPTNFKKAVNLYQGFSLVEVSPLTGRTHQIRVHFASQHHPVVADELYAGKKRIALDRRWCPRQFLHAAMLTFTHPHTHQQMNIEAPLPGDLQTVLHLLLPSSS